MKRCLKSICLILLLALISTATTNLWCQSPKQFDRFLVRKKPCNTDFCIISGVVYGKKLIGWRHLEKVKVRLLIDEDYSKSTISDENGYFRMLLDLPLVNEAIAIEFSHSAYLVQKITGIKASGLEVEMRLKGKPQYHEIKSR